MSMGDKGMVREYFAAANGYTGFRSYFKEVFSSKAFERVLIIKGGPGTGKSSYMKRIASRLREFYSTEAILCSSDPQSYDGVIIAKDDRKFAVLDGTAPHVRDTEIPGAIDEIINLGDNWDERWLAGKRDEILALSAEKKMAYEAAYNFLNLAGNMTRYKKELLQKNHLVNFKKQLKIVAEPFKKNGGTTDIRLISAFGKGGFVHIRTPEAEAKQIIGINGEHDAVGMFLRLVANDLEGLTNLTVFPDVLDAYAVEAIFIHDAKTLIRYAPDGEIVLPPICSTPTENEISRTLAPMHSDLLSETQRWFGIASELHFRLEDIYSAAMDYTKNERNCELTIEKIASAVERC